MGTITGTGDNDTISTSIGDDAVDALGGDDFISGSDGADRIDGGDGWDRLNFDVARSVQFSAPTGPRTYTLTASHLGDSSGSIDTGFGNVERVTLNTLNSGDFGDTIDASGFTSADPTVPLVLMLGNGGDTVIGSAMDDWIEPGLGTNTVDAGAGYDVVHATFDNSAGATLYVTGSGGAVTTTLVGITVNSIANAEQVRIDGYQATAAETLVDASGLTGFTGELMLWDHNGSDRLIGSAGPDIFVNIHGNEAGSDVYTGNGGRDVFDYTFAVGAMNGDTITDFDSDDLIDLQYNDPVNNEGGVLAYIFIGTAAFNGQAGEYRYQHVADTTLIQVDSNGDGAADETLTIANGAFALGETEAGSNLLRMVRKTVNGTEGSDTMFGTSGPDGLYGLGGDDALNGGLGDDLLDGGSGDDALRGQEGNDTLDGGEGADTLIGGVGDDTYVAGAGDMLTESAGEGVDTVLSSLSFTLGANFETLILTGTAAIDGTGNALANRLVGNSAANVLSGGSGADVLDGGAGADTMIGGAGNDIYHVDDASDVTSEDAGSGIDEVRACVSFALAANIEHLTLTGSAAIDGTGNALANIITGNGSANILNGGLGADTMEGEAGDDTFYVDNALDKVVEDAGGGTDRIYSAISLTLAANVENLTLLGTAAEGTGNALGNIIYGNAAANILNGGLGADTMVGGAGDDIYYVDDAGDHLVEDPGAGSDRVYSAIGYTLGPNVETLVLNGSSPVNGTGNALANTIYGNGAANILNGGLGADTMVGGAGDDIYYVDDRGDHLIENSGAGNDRVYSAISYTLGANVEALVLNGSAPINGTGNGAGNMIYGNAAANILNGGLGADRMAGGGGDDTYYVDDAGDAVVEATASGTDRVYSSISHALAANIEILVLNGTSAIDGTGNDLANTLYGNAAANTLSGGRGPDTLVGGAGSDLFLFDSALDGSGNVDRLADFTAADDTIALDQAIFLSLGMTGTLAASAFRAGTAAADADDRIIYDSANGSIYYDADGTGGGAQILFAQVAAGTALASSDFLVVG